MDFWYLFCFMVRKYMNYFPLKYRTILSYNFITSNNQRFSLYLIKKKNIFAILIHDQRMLMLDQNDPNFCSR